MSLRTWLAGTVAAGMLAHSCKLLCDPEYSKFRAENEVQLAKRAVIQADAILAALEEKEEPRG